MSRPVELLKFVPDSESLNVPKNETLRPIGVELFEVGLGRNLLDHIANNETLISLAEERRSLSKNFKSIFQKIENSKTPIFDALKEGLVTDTDLISLYNNLSDFLNADSNNGRLILYLPSQLLPDLTKDYSQKLTDSQLKFSQNYQTAWVNLLSESEIRSAYTNGDILEPELGETPRVRKAAHLIPDILRHNLVPIETIIDIFKNTDDPELSHSLSEGLIVAHDEKLIDTNDWIKIDNLTFENLKSIPENHQLPDSRTSWRDEIKKVEAQYAPSSPYLNKVTKGRADWEVKTKIENILDQAASSFANKYIKGEINSETVKQALIISDSDNACLLNLKTIFTIGENLSHTDSGAAKNFAVKFQDSIADYFLKSSNRVKDEILSGLSRWQKNKVVKPEFLESLGIELPDLSLAFPVNLEKLLKNEFKYLADASKKIAKDPFLSSHLYPVFLTFGSKIKGYASSESDQDVAIFFKPNTSLEKREEVLNNLHNKVPELNQIKQILEFWIDKSDNRYGFKPVTESGNMVGAKQIHFIFGGVWLGDFSEFNVVYEDIITKYLDLSRFGNQKELVRTHLLRQMELDVLQCRLLHKGYKRFYPETPADFVKSSELIDYPGTFWDPGYRRIATQLFLSRVFLPDLSLE